MLLIDKLKINIIRNKHFIPILSEVNLYLNRNETYVLMGESGCGKSMLALAILGLLPNNSEVEGSINFNNVDLLDKKVISKIRGRDISICWSNPDKHFNPLKKIGSQIAESYLIYNRVSFSKAKEKAINLLEKLNIENPEKVFNLFPYQLSGGMNQRAMIASSIINNPELLILDEPTRGLDENNIVILTDLLRSIDVPCKIIITHDPLMLSIFEGKVGVMRNGRMIYEENINSISRNINDPYLKYFLRNS